MLAEQIKKGVAHHVSALRVSLNAVFHVFRVFHPIESAVSGQFLTAELEHLLSLQGVPGVP
jgi:hypothetical protein